MFTFEFDAPKYKCFGGNQPRRSTITGIDSSSSNDKWFLNFDRPSSWQQMLKKDSQEKQEKEEIKEDVVENKPLKTDEQIRMYLQDIWDQLENQQKMAKQNGKKNQGKQLSIEKMSIKQLEEDIQATIKKSLSLLDQINTSQSGQIPNSSQIDQLPKVKKELILIKPNPIKEENQNTQAISSKTREGHKIPLKSMDQKNKKDSRKTKNLINPDKKSKSSKSLANVSKNQNLHLTKRNRPCDFPIRIQRQWQRDHDKKWYELTSPQMHQAQKSMKKRMQPKASKNSKFTKSEKEPQNKQKVSKSKLGPVDGQKSIKIVKNPFV